MTAAGGRGKLHRPARRDQRLRQLDEARTRPRRGDPARQGIHVGGEVAHVGHAHGVGEEAEHRRIVGRIAGEDIAVAARLDIDAEQLAHHLAAGRELVVVAEPAVDVDRAHLGVGTVPLEDPDDAQHVVMRQRGHVLAEVDGEVGRTIGLVRSDARARHVGQHLGTHGLQPALALGAFGIALHEAGAQLARLVVVPHPEGAVLADHGVDRPEAGDEVAPAGRPAGHRDHAESSLFQRFHGAIGLGGELGMGRHGLVDVGQHALDGGQGFTRTLGQRGQGLVFMATLLNMAPQGHRG